MLCLTNMTRKKLFNLLLMTSNNKKIIYFLNIIIRLTLALKLYIYFYYVWKTSINIMALG